MTLALTVLIFLSAIALLAIGVIFSRKKIKGSCCGASALDNIEANRKRSQSQTKE